MLEVEAPVTEGIRRSGAAHSSKADLPRSPAHEEHSANQLKLARGHGAFASRSSLVELSRQPTIHELMTIDPDKIMDAPALGARAFATATRLPQPPP